MKERLFVITMILICLSGCGHVISKDILKEVNTEITFAELRKAPKAYQGKVLLLGGVIVKAVNKRDGTILEVYQTEIGNDGRPVQLDISGGRFLAYYQGFLDSEIYCKGRKVTIAGIVQGERIMKLGEVDYRYPYLVIKDINLWKEEYPGTYELYPWGFWDLWWAYPWYPWHYPYWRYYH